MTVTTPDVANRIKAALLEKLEDQWQTIAQGRVYMPMDWPTQDADAPILKIQFLEEDKESKGNAGIQFDTAATIEVIGEVSRDATVGDSSKTDAGLVLTALGLFAREVELVVIGDPVLFGGAQVGLIQQLRSVKTRYANTAAGAKHRGAFSMTFEFVFYQGTEDFRQPPTTDIERFHIYADLINVADPSGTYTPPMTYVPTPAPRTSGPDGRVEGEVDVETS